MKKRLILSVREQKRLVVLNEVEKGRMVVREAAEVLGISERQGWRVLAAYREEGAAGLAHGNRGRKPVQVLAEEIRNRVVELARKKYVGFNHTHLTEMLWEEERIEVSGPADFVCGRDAESEDEACFEASAEARAVCARGDVVTGGRKPA